MKHYTALYAEDVPHYGILDIEVSDDADVLVTARTTKLSGITLDPDYENATCRRIVHIADEHGRIVAADVSLDDCFLRYGGQPERSLCDAAPDLLKAIEDIAAIVLWGEPILDASLKAELSEASEYDIEADSYNPCVDSESSALTQAVEIARTALAKMKGGAL